MDPAVMDVSRGGLGGDFPGEISRIGESLKKIIVELEQRLKHSGESMAFVGERSGEQAVERTDEADETVCPATAVPTNDPRNTQDPTRALERSLGGSRFIDNLNHIEQTNREKTSYSLGLNEFADISHEEFKEKYLGVKVRDDRVSISQTEESFICEDVMDLPKSIDWRKKGAVAPVKNQGQCGSCWAFSTVAAVEGINQIVTGNLTILSEQELIDCDTAFNSGCNGGLMDYAFSYIASNGGLHTEVDYPYIMEEGTCDSKRGELEVVTVSGYEDVPKNSEVSLLKALAHQPVSVAIEASGRDFQFYSAGVFDGHCGTKFGYGTSNNQDYIIVRNSWGPKWGEKGYIRMKRNIGKPEGLCRIYKMASYPTKK